jgi:hypothetical protein
MAIDRSARRRRLLWWVVVVVPALSGRRMLVVLRPAVRWLRWHGSPMVVLLRRLRRLRRMVWWRGRCSWWRRGRLWLGACDRCRCSLQLSTLNLDLAVVVLLRTQSVGGGEPA